MKAPIIALMYVAGLARYMEAEGQIPTVDIEAIVQMSELILQTAEQIEHMRMQVRLYEKQIEHLTGSRNIGQILNSPQIQIARRHIPRTWKETLELVEQGGIPAEYAELYNTVRQTREAGEEEAVNVQTESDLERAARYSRQARDLYTLIGLGQNVFNKSRRQVDEIETLLGEIDNAEDLKAAIDLQNRLQAENALLLNELLTLQSTAHISAVQTRQEAFKRRQRDAQMADPSVPAIDATLN